MPTPIDTQTFLNAHRSHKADNSAGGSTSDSSDKVGEVVRKVGS